jgi:hypothetical protein
LIQKFVCLVDPEASSGLLVADVDECSRSDDVESMQLTGSVRMGSEQRKTNSKKTEPVRSSEVAYTAAGISLSLSVLAA